MSVQLITMDLQNLNPERVSSQTILRCSAAKKEVLLGIEENSRHLAQYYTEKFDSRFLQNATVARMMALYLESTDDLYHGRFAEARATLEEILKHPDPVHDPAMIAWPLIKLGMSYDLAGDRDRALSYYNQVFKMKNGAGAQFVADKLLEDPIEPKDPFIGY